MSAAVQSAALPGEAYLQQMQAQHLEDVLRVEQRAYPHPWTHSNFLDALNSGNQAQMLLADACLLGYFVAMQGVEEVHLLNLTVAPEYQRQGWAHLLLDALALWARGQRCACLWLEVRTSNQRARQVYEAYGYFQAGVRKSYYPAAHGLREDAIVMRLPL